MIQRRSGIDQITLSETKPIDPDNPCGDVITGKTGGLIKSPKIETKYETSWICHWDITVRPKYKILLQPVIMKVEGDIEDGSQSELTFTAPLIRRVDSLVFQIAERR